MDQTTGIYWCDSCKLDFKSYKHFLSHKYLNHDEQELQTEMNYNGEVAQNFSNNSKSFCEMHIGKIPLEEQLIYNEQTQSSEDVFNKTFDLSDRDKNQFHDVILFESTVIASESKINIGYIQDPAGSYHSTSEGKTNERSLSLKRRKMEICRLDRSPQVNINQPSNPQVKINQPSNPQVNINQPSNPQVNINQPSNSQVNISQPSMSSECSQMEMHTHEMGEQLNRNQSSKYSQMPVYFLIINQKVNFNQPNTSSEIKRMGGNNPKVNNNYIVESYEYSPIQFSTFKSNQHFNTNQLSVPAEYRKTEFDNYEKNQHFNTNKLAVSDEYTENKFSTREMNPRVKVNQRAHTEARENISLPGRASSPQCSFFNKIDLNLQKQSRKDQINLYSIGRSNIINVAVKNMEYLEQRGAFPFLTTTPNELDVHEESFPSNSQLKSSDVHQKKFKKYRKLLNNKRQVTQPEEKTYVCKIHASLFPYFKIVMLQ
ncbi:hypothetical protein TNCT_466761 [Trichonephila clavata]|uniref:C2H2-type domain-containing protein n=1 Tax=Trichonephila clavata TaxID=2740835 RepID=A0A8X6H1X4_TRICU|nr:hypothetical protein TNCT_466761 [Trichonephila clavata]